MRNKRSRAAIQKATSISRLAIASFFSASGTSGPDIGAPLKTGILVHLSSPSNGADVVCTANDNVMPNSLRYLILVVVLGTCSPTFADPQDKWGRVAAGTCGQNDCVGITYSDGSYGRSPLLIPFVGWEAVLRPGVEVKMKGIYRDKNAQAVAEWPFVVPLKPDPSRHADAGTNERAVSIKEDWRSWPIFFNGYDFSAGYEIVESGDISSLTQEGGVVSFQAGGVVQGKREESVHSRTTTYWVDCAHPKWGIKNRRTFTTPEFKDGEKAVAINSSSVFLPTASNLGAAVYKFGCQLVEKEKEHTIYGRDYIDAGSCKVWDSNVLLNVYQASQHTGVSCEQYQWKGGCASGLATGVGELTAHCSDPQKKDSIRKYTGRMSAGKFSGPGRIELAAKESGSSVLSAQFIEGACARGAIGTRFAGTSSQLTGSLNSSCRFEGPGTHTNLEPKGVNVIKNVSGIFTDDSLTGEGRGTLVNGDVVTIRLNKEQNSYQIVRNLSRDSLDATSAAGPISAPVGGTHAASARDKIKNNRDEDLDDDQDDETIQLSTPSKAYEPRGVGEALQELQKSATDLVKSYADLRREREERAEERARGRSGNQTSSAQRSSSCDIDMAGVQRPSYCPNSKGMDGSGLNIRRNKGALSLP